MKKSLVAGVVAMAMFSFGAQANGGQGVVNFKGSVIDAPCGIASGSADQTIDFGQISKAALEANGTSVKQNLDIKLVNCSLAKAPAAGGAAQAPFKRVTVSFTGTTINGQNNELGTTGKTGTAIVVSDASGKSVDFTGTAGAASNLQDGDNTLRYSAWVKKATTGTLSEGDFSAVANFNLTYQ
ncbi:fimbrial protein [Escherichia coli]|uniref:fimbrial protein n=1 Tax=Escherichia coli TaxID=562 RepID=UPI0009437F36|nr:fimbrial protein [Escherichia coli]OKU25452.1 F7-2 fimbrial protein [Escherichia coli]